ncbi:MAG: GrpB family protein, partial [Chloroflexi bacterium]|nr:GrpB family protein [Chloroflexota bacterium]
KLFFRSSADARRVNIHVRVAGHANRRYALLFRDYLRCHAEAAEAYAKLKLRLAALVLEIDDYNDIKDPVCDLIMIAAEAWAATTHWQAGPSDI